MAADPDAGSGANGGEVDDGISPSPTAITLASFNAAPQDSAILIAWETASELDNVGVNLFGGVVTALGLLVVRRRRR